MSTQTNAVSLRNVARATGVLYIVIIVAGIVAEFAIRSSLIVADDAAETAANILASESLFRASIAADFIMIAADVAIALMFYELLKPVNRTLALMAALFRLGQAVILGINLLNLWLAIELLNGAGYLGTLATDEAQSMALLFLNAHATGYRFALIFFALSILIVSYLMLKSAYFPRILAIGLMFASVGYFVDSFAGFLLSNYTDYADVFGMVVFLPAFIAELSLGLWLLVRGVKQTDVPYQPESAGVERVHMTA